MGITYAYLCNVENEKSSPSPEIIEKFHEAWGIDLYMYAVAFQSDDRKTPHSLREPVKALAEGWREHVDRLVKKRAREDGKSSLTSAD